MQYDQQATAPRLDLPRPSIDTGMGLERIAAVMQGVHDNYDTDTFKALIAQSVALTKVPAEGEARASHRVIADHLRSSSFLIADGVLPAAEGRGYVLRRIMRRAMRHAQLLGAAEPLMHRLVGALVSEMGAAYPELVRARPLIEETLLREETRFRQTLVNGLKLLDEAVAGLPEGATLPGETAFKLYDTYGFPYDLTEDALRTQGLTVDRAGFDAAMALQKAAAKAAWKGSGQKASEEIWFDIAESEGATEFTGYLGEAGEGQVVALVRDGARVDRASAGESVAILTNQTPFYGESGRPGRRRRDHQHARRPARSCRGHGQAARAPPCPSCDDRIRQRRGRRHRPSRGGPWPPRPHPRQSQRDASAPRGPARGTRPARHAERQPRRRGSPALRLLAPRGTDAGPDRRRRGRCERADPQQCRGFDAAHVARGCHRSRRHGAVRRENMARKCASSRWA